MKKLLLSALFVGVPLVVGCTQETIVRRQTPAPETPAEQTEEQPPGEEGTKPPGTKPPGEEEQNPANPTPSTKPEDTCLDGQDINGADVDITKCPALPSIPDNVMLGTEKISLGAWELGTTSAGATYKYGTLSAPGGTGPRTLSYEGGTVAVNDKNIECWAKGYYRLREILQDPPAEWLALKKAGFQYRFFQFQTDLRNGPTGYKAISSFQDHLVKWVTVITAQGVCQQPTRQKFIDYAKSELQRRGLPLPTK